jgi:hypothetical protein
MLSKSIASSLLTLSLLNASPIATAEENDLRDFGFQPLEIYQFKNGTSRLLVEDLNGDGLDDIVFANNHVSRLEVLLRKKSASTNREGGLPELEEQFDDRGFIVDQQIKALLIKDLNNDGRKDILTFGTDIGIQLRYQQEDGSFSEATPVYINNKGNVVAIQAEDLNEDGKNDLLICYRDGAIILWNDDTNSFTEKLEIFFSRDNCQYGDIADCNGDSIPDLVFHHAQSRTPLKVRFGLGKGLFGTEQSIELPPRQYVDLLKQEGAPPAIGMILRNRLAFRQYSFTEKEQPPLNRMQEASPERIGLEGTDKKILPDWTVFDFNDDGFEDMLIAAPALSRLHLYRGSADGLHPEPQRMDTLSQVTRLSRLPDGDILVISQNEKIAALHCASKLDQFPKILKLPGDVLAGAGMETRDAAWFVCKDDEKQLHFVRAEADGERISLYPLEGKNEPRDMMAFSLPDETTGIMLFMPYDTPRMFIYKEEEITEINSESFRALTQQLSRTHIRLHKRGDGSLLTVSHGAISRRFKWENDQYVVVQQFNPENARSELVASTPYQFLDGSSGTLIYDSNSATLIRYPDGPDNWSKIHIPDADPSVFEIVQLKNSQRDILLLLDRTGLSLIQGKGSRLSAKIDAEYVSPSDKPSLTYMRNVHLGPGKRPMIALVDQANRSIELISNQDGKLINELCFEVFLVSDFAVAADGRNTEPRDLQSGDLNGDGIGDLVLLSQDKLLIYLGE